MLCYYNQRNNKILFFLIKRGGGIGPYETWQPAFAQLLIPAGLIPGEMSRLGKNLFIEEIFLF